MTTLPDHHALSHLIAAARGRPDAITLDDSRLSESLLRRMKADGYEVAWDGPTDPVVAHEAGCAKGLDVALVRRGLEVLHSPHFGWGCTAATCSGQAALDHLAALEEAP